MIMCSNEPSLRGADLDDARLQELLAKTIQDPEADVLVEVLTSPEDDRRLDLVTSERKRVMFFSLNWKSCSSVFGRNLISLTLNCFCFFLAECSFFFRSYRNCP
jgi:hypothetical protein